MNPSTQDSTYSLRTAHDEAGEDSALVSRVASGDETALAGLYDRWVHVVYSLAMQLLRDADEAEDVVEETFWHAWQRASAYDMTYGTVRTWLLTIGRNRTLDRLRSRRRHGDNISLLSEDVVMLAADSDPLQGAEERERRTLVLNALRELPQEQRSALELAYFHGLNQTEVAERLSEPLGTVKTRMRLGMHKLREKLFALRQSAV